jgi:hypothetical protein
MKNIEVYLDYVNNYLTIKLMAEHYGMDCDKMYKIITLGRMYYVKLYS